jgi:hypothetical protein
MRKIKSILAVLIVSSFTIVGSACSSSSSSGNSSNSELDKAVADYNQVKTQFDEEYQAFQYLAVDNKDGINTGPAEVYSNDVKQISSNTLDELLSDGENPSDEMKIKAINDAIAEMTEFNKGIINTSLGDCGGYGSTKCKTNAVNDLYTHYAKTLQIAVRQNWGQPNPISLSTCSVTTNNDFVKLEKNATPNGENTDITQYANGKDWINLKDDITAAYDYAYSCGYPKTAPVYN